MIRQWWKSKINLVTPLKMSYGLDPCRCGYASYYHLLTVRTALGTIMQVHK